MQEIITERPSLTLERAARLAVDLWGLELDSPPRELPSERDRNFHLAAADGEWVLKLANPAEQLGVLECQAAVLERLAAETSVPVPSLRPTASGDLLTSVVDDDERECAVRLVRFLPGRSLRHVRPHTASLLQAVGEALGVVDHCLEGFDHPAAHRPFFWEISRSRSVVENHMDSISNGDRRATVAKVLAEVERETAACLSRLPRSVIHNDANDDNVLVGFDGFEPRLAGLIDFGDLVHSWTAADLAIALAYVLPYAADPLAAARPLVLGYHSRRPLSEDELASLFPLARLRLATSVTVSAYRRAQGLTDAYLSNSEDAAWRTLERLDAIHPDFALAALRHVCRFDASPRRAAVRAWLRRQTPAPVLGDSFPPAELHVLDLGMASALLGSLDDPSDVAAFEDAVARELRAAGATVGIGRYDEARPVYAGEQYRGAEPRTVHLGLDLFAPAGQEVRAPLTGTLISAADNAVPYDYGPTLVLEHRTDGGVPFYSLYGHLSRDSLGLREPGQVIAAGEVLGRLGTREENGGWPPHLHLQVLLELFALFKDGGNYPGVARPAERSLWLDLCPSPAELLHLPPLETRAPDPDVAELERRRRALLAPNLSLSYRRPLHFVLGRGARLHDAEGRPYLDLVNNVAHVGHCHPRVVRAIRQQAALLSTNTRYLHRTLVELAERLVSTFPEPLRVCVFVNSGSEANDLALRLARAHTGSADLLVLDGAYHGNLQSLIDASPYKHAGPGGSGAPPHVHVLPLADPYRGPFRGRDRASGDAYARQVAEMAARLEGSGRRPGALLLESFPSCAGQIVFPDGYLEGAFAAARRAGAVCIADEVQVGFGRVGTHMWGFETQGVVPDIVTLGKSMGNGHPVGAVVTTAEIAASFANGMEYFNTYGGNPVSAAAALAVLDIIEEEGLRQHALQVGLRFRSGLEELARRHPLVGDVRGAGLFLGVELVVDRHTLEPAAEQTAYVVERIKEAGALLSADGVHHNVIKIKPPLVLGESDVDRVIELLDEVLGDTVLQTASSA